jgi:hypothetical protein
LIILYKQWECSKKTVIREKVKVREDKSLANEKEVRGLFKYFCTALICMALLLARAYT